MDLYINAEAKDAKSAFIEGIKNLGVRKSFQATMEDTLDLNIIFTDSKGEVISWSGEAGHAVAVAVGTCKRPDSGQWTAEKSSAPLNLSEVTLDATATTAALKTSIAANSDAAEDDLIVRGGPGYYEIEFVGALAETAIGQITVADVNLSPVSVANSFVIKSGGTGQNEIQAITLDATPIAFVDGLSVNSAGNGYTGELKFTQHNLLRALEDATNDILNTLIAVRVTHAGGRAQTYAKAGIRVDCNTIPTGAFAASSLPDTLTMAEALETFVQINGEAVVSSIATKDPGIFSMDEAVAELEGSELVVPSPGKGNFLLVRRSTGGTPGGDEITSFSGLSKGTIYWLLFDDGTNDPIRYKGLLIRDGGGPVPIRAISETAAVFAAPMETTYSFGGDNPNSSEQGQRYLIANGRADEVIDTSLDNEDEHSISENGVIVAAAIRMENSTMADEVDLFIAVNGTVEATLQIANANQGQVVNVNFPVSKGDRVAVGTRGTGEAPGEIICSLIVQH